MDLPVDDHRVDDVPAVVHGHEAAHLHHPRATVDVDDGDVAPEREGEVRRVIVRGRLETCLHALRVVGVGGERDVLDRLRPLGRALHRELARLPDQVVLGALEQVRGNLLRLLADLPRRYRRGCARSGRGPARVGAKPVRRGVCIALFHLDVRRGDAQLLGDDLGVGRLVPLPLRLGAEAREGLAGRVHPDLRRVEHLDAEDVELLAGPRADDLGEAGDPDAHQLAAGALLRLLLAQVRVADLVHRLLQRRGVVAAVVLPAQRRLVRELLLGDEVLHAQLGRIHLQFLREHVGDPLDAVHRLGDPERAAVRDPPGRLVGVDAVHLGECALHVVRPGADGEQAGGELGRVGSRVGVAVVGERLDLERRHRAVLLRRQLRVDVVVAGEGVGLEVLHPVLHPFDRFADHHGRRHRDHVARVDGDLAAEAAADVRRNDPDLLLGESDVSGDEREHRPDRVRRLRGHVDGQLAVDPVEIGDAAAGLDRRDVDPRQVHVLRHHHVGLGERLVRCLAVAGLPVEDAVVLLVLLVGAEDRRRGVERLEGIHHHRQRIVLDLHGLDPVRGDVPVRRDHRRDLLRLVHDLLGRQHHLRVRHQGRHPVQVVLGERLAGDHREDPRDLQRLGCIDPLDGGVRIGAPDDVHPEHAGQDEVVDVLSGPADEARVLLALDRVTHAADFGRCLGLELRRHLVSPLSSPEPLRWSRAPQPARPRRSQVVRTPAGSP